MFRRRIKEGLLPPPASPSSTIHSCALIPTNEGRTNKKEEEEEEEEEDEEEWGMEGEEKVEGEGNVR